MLRLDLFKRRNFAVGNAEALALYGGLSALYFFTVLYLQQVARYSPLQSGLALLPESLVRAIGALVAAQFSASPDYRLAHQPVTPRGRATVNQAKQLTLGTPPVAGLPRHEAL